MTLTSEYEKILNIINEEKNKRNKNKVNESPSKESKNNLKDYNNLDLNNEIIEHRNTEFSLKKLKTAFRKELLSDYYNYRNYKRPFISVTEVLSCIKKAYYFRMKYNPNENYLFNNPHLLLIQEGGKLVHKIIQKFYDFDYVEKVLKSDKYKIKGKVDGIKSKTVFEIKMVDHEEFKKIKTIRDNDYNQAITYTYLLIHDFNFDINSIECIYVSRNLKDINVLKSDINLGKAKKFLDKSLMLYDSLTKSKIPEIDFNEDNQECYFCEFKDQCIKDVKNTNYTNKNITLL
jgi:CRISPR/Cas system-associated exonuclease Cas4 (RecB family)